MEYSCKDVNVDTSGMATILPLENEPRVRLTGPCRNATVATAAPLDTEKPHVLLRGWLAERRVGFFEGVYPGPP